MAWTLIFFLEDGVRTMVVGDDDDEDWMLNSKVCGDCCSLKSHTME